MPADHGLWAHHDEDLAPLRPEASESDPEEAAGGGHSATGQAALQDGELLAECQVLEDEVGSGAE